MMLAEGGCCSRVCALDLKTESNRSKTSRLAGGKRWRNLCGLNLFILLGAMTSKRFSVGQIAHLLLAAAHCILGANPDPLT